MPKLFSHGAELRLTSDDVKQLLQEGLKSEVFNSLTRTKVKVSDMTLHPSNKYVVRLTLEPNTQKENEVR